MTSSIRRNTSRRGSALVEFALTAFLLLMVIFGVIEMQRMLLVYTTLNNAARVGVRYAITHGQDRASGSGVDGPSSSVDHSQVDTVVKNFASAGLLTTSALVITVDYPDAATRPGDRVRVNVKYTYDPIVRWFKPLQVTLGSTSWGRITF
jgi:Flp pilus assembly protein TadG